MNPAAALLRIQELDLEIMRFERQLDSLPEKQAILDARAKLKEVDARLEKGKTILGAQEAELKRLQDEIAMLEAKIAAEQDKVMSGAITAHKEVAHITREMDSLRQRKDGLDTQALRFMERVEQAEAGMAHLDEARTELASREDALIARFKEIGGEIRSQVAQRVTQRAKLAELLTPALLKRYDTAREQRGGVGVGKLEADACSACHSDLPTESLRDLSMGDPIAECPACGRLLVVRLV